MGGTSCDSSPRKLNSFYAAERGETEELRSPDSWIYLSLLFPHSPPPYGKHPWIMLLSVSTWSLSSCSIITFLMTWPDIKHLTPHTSDLRLVVTIQILSQQAGITTILIQSAHQLRKLEGSCYQLNSIVGNI